MLDVDGLVADLEVASRETDPLLAVRDVLDRVLERPADVEAALPTTRAELTPLHVTDDLTVLKVVWAPEMWIEPHEHRMWAAIGIYGGRENNAFYRREGTHLVPSGGRELHTSDVALLGDDVVHSVKNPAPTFTGAIHVYGGNLLTEPRKGWDQESLEQNERPADSARWFAEWNDRLGL